MPDTGQTYLFGFAFMIRVYLRGTGHWATRTVGRCGSAGEQLALSSGGDGCPAGIDAEFGEDRDDMAVDGSLADEQCRSNFSVGLTLGDQLEHVELS